MSDVILYEGGKKRKLAGVGLIETDTKDGGTCLWRREDTVSFEPIEITENGYYAPPYAYSEVDVDVKEKVSDWDVFIDEWGFPHIELDDLDLSFDFDGMPDLDGVDFDLDDIDFGDFGFDSDFDISLDDLDLDLSGLDLDGLDLDLSLDLDTLDLELHELPDEIRIMHVPNKTSYKDGEEIDLDGLVVQAYRNGEVWEDEEGKYAQGYIPVHELLCDPKIVDIEDYPSNLINALEKHSDRFVSSIKNRHFIAKANINTTLFANRNDNLSMRFTALSEMDGQTVEFGALAESAPYTVTTNKAITFAGKTVYVSNEFSYSHNCTENISPYYEQYVELDTQAIESALNNSVVISWSKPQNGVVLTAKFSISVESEDGE